MRRVLDVWVPGIPKTQGSKDNLGGGRMREVSNRNGELDVWRSRVTAACMRALSSAAPVGLAEVAMVRCVFLVRGASDADVMWATGDGDGDKLERAAWDAVTKSGAWQDDAQVCVWSGMRWRVFGFATTGVRIQLDALSGDEAQEWARVTTLGLSGDPAPSFWTEQGR